MYGTKQVKSTTIFFDDCTADPEKVLLYEIVNVKEVNKLPFNEETVDEEDDSGHLAVVCSGSRYLTVKDTMIE